MSRVAASNKISQIKRRLLATVDMFGVTYWSQNAIELRWQVHASNEGGHVVAACASTELKAWRALWAKIEAEKGKP